MLESELFSLLENTADAAFAIDEWGTICSWNHSAERLFGYSASDALRRPCASLFRGQGQFGCAVCSEPCPVIECAKTRGEVPQFDMQVLDRSGRRIWINVSILIFHDERKHRDLVVHLARDVGARKQREDLATKLVGVARQITGLADATNPLPPVPELTEQERRILTRLAEGMNPTAVARALEITPHTLRNHLHHINQKLRTHSRLEAVTQASRRAII